MTQTQTSALEPTAPPAAPAAKPEVIEVTETLDQDLGLDAALEGNHHQVVLREDDPQKIGTQPPRHERADHGCRSRLNGDRGGL